MLCEAVCGLSVDVEGGAVRSVRGDPDDPFSRGHICPKAAAIVDVQDDPDRVREPLRRTQSGWEPISWDAALDEAGERLAALQQKHGRSAVATYIGNPTVHSYGAMIGIRLFLQALGGRARFSATSVDQLPQMLASQQLFGHQLLLPIPDVDRTRLFVVIGGNPLASNGSLMTAGGIGRRLQALRARGGRLIVIDPRRTETAEAADQHLAIRPGTDALLLLALHQVIFEEQRATLGHLAQRVQGLDELKRVARGFPPERVAQRTGLAADAIRSLAREIATTRPAAIYGRVGVCTQEFGGLAAWLVVTLNAITGNLDREGGVLFTTPAADLVGLSAKSGDTGHFGAWRSRVRGLPEFGGELPLATLAEEIETPGDGQIRGLVTFAGNPALSAPNGARLSKALSKLDYMVSIDVYRNETTRHANLILPTSFGFERDHFDLIFYLFAVRNAARYVEALVDPPPGVRHDFDALLDLALALRKHGGGRKGFLNGVALRTSQQLGPRRLLELMLRFGPHGLTLQKLRENPHGLDLGPLQPSLQKRLAKGASIPLAPELFLRDVPRLEASLGQAAPELVLIGRRSLRSNNSWMHNSHRLVKGKPQCTLLVNPRDAAARGLANGARAELSSRAGRVEVPIEVSDEVPAGVVCLPHGYGHGAQGAQLSIANAHAGASVNDVTDELAVDPLSGNAALNGVAVAVTALQGGR
jgi:anaerobic selenocysteine-containing dehydrogenase